MSKAKVSFWKYLAGLLVLATLFVAFGTRTFRSEYKTYAFSVHSYAEIDLDDRYLDLIATDLAYPEWRHELYTLIEIVSEPVDGVEEEETSRRQTAIALLYGAMWQLDQSETIIDCELAMKLLDLQESDLWVTTCTSIQGLIGRSYATGRSEHLGVVITRILERRCYERSNTPAELHELILTGCS